MSKKKAFVKYAQNKAVAGSLIIRETAPKVGVWKEVPYDLCCDSFCPQSSCIDNDYLFAFTPELAAEATGNTEIDVIVAGQSFVTRNNFNYNIMVRCDGGVSNGSGNGADTYIKCGIYPIFFFFKNDVPVYLDPIFLGPTEGPCIP